MIAFPLSFAQQRLWFLDQLEPGNAFYNVFRAFRLDGRLDRRALEHSFQALVDRHESLRTTFTAGRDEPLQVVAASRRQEVPLIDLAALAAGGREAVVRRLAAEEAQRAFDLERGPLLRVTLLRLGRAGASPLVIRGDRGGIQGRLDGEQHVLFLTLHHIVSDAWSAGVLLRDVVELYGACLEGRPPELPELPVQYADFAEWQREWLQGEVLEAQLDYWRRQLAGAPVVLELPSDRPRPAMQTYRGAHLPSTFRPALSERLRELGGRQRATPFMTLLAAFVTLLFRYTGKDDVCIGTSLAGRTEVETEGLIGFFVNTLVMRTDLTGNPTFCELVSRVREVVLEAQTHQDLPFEKLVEELQPERDLSRSPIFQVMFNLLNTPRSALAMRGLEIVPLAGDHPVAKFDLTLAMTGGEHFHGIWEYNTDLFDRSTVGRMRDHFRILLGGIVERPQERVAALSLLSLSERHQLVVEWNVTAAAFPPPAVVHELFAAQAARTPEAVAVSQRGRALSYGELNRRANRAARSLAARGVGAEQVVAVLDRRGIDLVTAILAVFKAGGVYLPLDPFHPPERLRRILVHSASRLAVAGDGFAERLQGVLAELAEDHRPAVVPLCRLLAEERAAGDLPATAEPVNLAYMIYTSGSTGVPKGVMLHHRGMLNHLCAKVVDLELGPDDVVAQTAPQTFDISLWQLLAATLIGGRVHVVGDETVRAPNRLLEEAAREGFTALEIVPSLLRALLGDPSPVVPASLRSLMVVGEALPPDLCRSWFEACPRIPLLNAYGPTECCDIVAQCLIERPPGADAVRMPIGRPLANLSLYVLRGDLVPLGAPGELCVGGIGVGRGYLGDPARTAEVFVPDPLSGHPGQRLYRTGDLGRYRADGTLEFLGRIDHQVKVRGFRIEPGEIERVLLAHPAVREAVVTARDDPLGDKRLVAYLVPAAPPRDVPSEILAREIVPQVREMARRLLPEYMVPGQIVVLEALPLLPNGKVDRQALPEPGRLREAAGEAFQAPRNEAEALLAGIWLEVLAVDRIAAGDNFFALGGHSLSATRVLARIRETFRVELSLRVLFEAPTLTELAGRIERALRQDVGGSVLRPEPVRRDGPLPLSFAQQRLWFLDRLEPGSPVYNMFTGLRVTGPLADAALERTLNEIVRRHEVLRTRFAEIGEEAVQIVAPGRPLAFVRVDLHGLEPGRRQAEVRRLMAREARRPFDLTRAPLIRTSLLRLGRAEHVVLLAVHHVAADGWSMAVVYREMMALYPAFCEGRPSPLPELPIQYADYAVAQRRWLQGEVLAAHLAYWTEQLGGAPPVLELPTDRPRPALVSYRGAEHGFAFPPQLSREIKELAQRRGTTLFMTLLAAFQALLHRYAGQPDVCVGTPIAGRNHVATEGLIGCLINTLVLRADLRGGPIFGELLSQVREVVLAAHAHQELPFELLVEELSPARSLAHSPLFQVMFILHNMPQDGVELPGLEVSSLAEGTGTAKFDLNLSLAEAGESLAGSLEYATDLFDATTVRRLVEHFRVLLAGAVADPDRRCGELPLLAPAERHQTLVELNDTRTAEAAERRLHRLFEAQVDRTPERVALVFGTASLSYRELNGRANRLARHLRDLGVGPEVQVEVCLERTPSLVVALLAVLKAGGAYVPLDPAYPDERFEVLSRHGRARVLVTRRALLTRLPAAGKRVVRLDCDRAAITGRPAADLAAGAGPQNLAYVIYTSGSTGVPKGVGIEHRSAADLVHWTREVFPDADLDGVLASTSISFDLSVFELFVTLGRGGMVILAGDVLELPELPAASRVTLINTVPSAIAELTAAGALPATVRTVNLAGEVLDGAVVDRVYERPQIASVLNLYGPSEDTTYTTFVRVPRVRPGEPTIGRPVADTRIHLLDPGFAPVPLGVPGELCVGGRGSARGYLNSAGLTAEKWRPDPFADRPGDRLYCTGDLARYRGDGELEFLGRRDHQVKVRGFRVELGEIETMLAGHPEVRAAVVLAPGEGVEKRLVGYLVPETGRELSPAAIRAFLRDKLPAHLVPASWVVMESLPLLPNGKVDRRALPAPGAPRRGEDALAPRDSLEMQLAGIWEEVLGVGQVGVRDDFFDLGGHSLLAVRLLGRVRQRFGRELPLSTLFQRPTVEELAAVLRRPAEEAPASPLVTIRAGGERRPFFCVHPVGGNVVCYRPLAHRLSAQQPFWALEAPGLVAGSEPLRSVEEMAALYVEALREVEPQGPYLVGGWSSGGVIAFEMAQELVRQGLEVALLAIVDSFVPAEIPHLEARQILLLHAWQLGLPYEALAALDADQIIDYLGDKMTAGGMLPAADGKAQIRRLVAVYQANLAAVRRYEPRPYPGSLTLFRARRHDEYGDYGEHFSKSLPDPAVAWRELTRGSLQVLDLAATHNTLMTEPHVGELAQHLDACLARANGAPPAHPDEVIAS